jgi:hypothetical protein
MRKLLLVLFLFGCKSELTAPQVGGDSRCQRGTAAVRTFAHAGNVYTLEVGLCAYRTPAPEGFVAVEPDSMTIVISGDELVAAARRAN